LDRERSTDCAIAGEPMIPYEEEQQRLTHKEQQIEATYEELERYERKLSESINHYHYVQQAERQLMEEVAFFSQGTIVEAHSLDQIEQKEYVEKQRFATFQHMEETIQHQKQQFRKELESIEEEKSELKRKEIVEEQEDQDAKN